MARSYHTHKSFMAIAEEEKLRAKGFAKIKEYPRFWLCGKLDKDGNIMYRECFSKWDLGNRGQQRDMRQNIGGYHSRKGGKHG